MCAPPALGRCGQTEPYHSTDRFLKMMKTLRLNEGDPIRVTGARLPKGKFIKLQAQTVDFIEVSDPKAV